MGKNSLQMVLLAGNLIRNDKNEILLVQEARDKSYSKCKDKWTLPHGSYDKLNESVLDLAKRELLEESGFSCNYTGKYRCIEGYSETQNRILLISIIFEGKDAIKLQEPLADEIKDFRYFSIEEIKKMLIEGQIRDDTPIDKIFEAFDNDQSGIIRWNLPI